MGVSVAAHRQYPASADVPLPPLSDDATTGEEEHLLGGRRDHLPQPGDAGTRSLVQRLDEASERG